MGYKALDFFITHELFLHGFCICTLDHRAYTHPVHGFAGSGFNTFDKGMVFFLAQLVAQFDCLAIFTKTTHLYYPGLWLGTGYLGRSSGLDWYRFGFLLRGGGYWSLYRLCFCGRWLGSCTRNLATRNDPGLGRRAVFVIHGFDIRFDHINGSAGF